MVQRSGGGFNRVGERFEATHCFKVRKLSAISQYEAGKPRPCTEGLGGRATRGTAGGRAIGLILLCLRRSDVQSHVWATPPTEWRWSSARWYDDLRTVCVRSNGWTDAWQLVQASCYSATQTLKAASGPPACPPPAHPAHKTHISPLTQGRLKWMLPHSALSWVKSILPRPVTLPLARCPLAIGGQIS